HLLAEVAGEQQEAPEPLGQVDLKHMPQDRTAADLHHRLGDGAGVLLKARAPPAAEDDHRGPRAMVAGPHRGGLSGIISIACPSSPTPRCSRPTTSAACTATS